MSQTPTYDQLHEERIDAASDTDSAQVDHSGKHRLGDDPAAAMVRDRPPGPEADLPDDWSGFKTDRSDHRGKHRPNDSLTTAAVPGRSPRRAVDLTADWSWFGPNEPNRAAARNVVALMSAPTLIDRTHALLTVLAELDVRPTERVLIMLPEGPGFTESFAAAFYRDAMPLPVNPLLCAPDLAAAATHAHAHLVLASPEQLPTLTELTTEPPVLIHGPHGPWAAALRLR